MRLRDLCFNKPPRRYTFRVADSRGGWGEIALMGNGPDLAAYDARLALELHEVAPEGDLLPDFTLTPIPS